MKTFDAILGHVGAFGRYQKFVGYGFGGLFIIIGPISFFMFIFLGFSMQHVECDIPTSLRKALPSNSTALFFSPNNDYCKVYNLSEHGWMYDERNLTRVQPIPCPFGYKFSDPKWTDTLISRFSLICDKGIEMTNVLTLYWVGAAVGTFIWSPIQDIIGRKPLLFVTSAWTVVWSLALCFVPNLKALKAFSFMMGLQNRITFPLAWIYIQEFTDIRHQTYFLIPLCILWTVGCLALSLVAWLATTWRTIVVYCIIGYAILFIPVFFLDESPRWLMSVGKLEKAKRIIHKIGRINGTLKGSKSELELDSLIDQKFAEKVDDSGIHSFYWSLFTNGWSIAGKTLIFCLTQSTCMMIYMGLATNIENFGADPILTFAVSSLVDFPAALLCPLADYVGRVPVAFFSFVICGIFAIGTTFCGGECSTGVTILMVFITRLSITLAWDVIYLVNAEVFPTVIRATATGFPSLISMVCAITIPIIIYSSTMDFKIPMIIFATISFLCAAVTIFIPETSGVPFIDTLEDEMHVRLGMANMKRNVVNTLSGGALVRKRIADLKQAEASPLWNKKDVGETQ